MRAHRIRLLATAGACTFLLIGSAPSAGGASPGKSLDRQELRSEVQGENRRAIDAPAGTPPTRVPTIGFIDSPTATCYQPDPAANVCYINWYYLNVAADPNYILWMQAEINVFGKVARYQGFFQTSMYVPHSMHDRGFKVACGALGAGGDVELGNAYAYTIRARDSADLGSANYGTVFCPAFTP